jgi:hypothetical protein
MVEGAGTAATSASDCLSLSCTRDAIIADPASAGIATAALPGGDVAARNINDSRASLFTITRSPSPEPS